MERRGASGDTGQVETRGEARREPCVCPGSTARQRQQRPSAGSLLGVFEEQRREQRPEEPEEGERCSLVGHSMGRSFCSERNGKALAGLSRECRDQTPVLTASLWLLL